MSASPSGLAAADLTTFLADLERGADWKSAYEALLLDLDVARAEAAMQWMREGRGAWLPLSAAHPGRALVVGDALGGAAVALARAGHDVVMLDDDAGRLAAALHRDRALAGGRAEAVRGGESAQLPFADGAFDLVLQEEGPPGVPGARFRHDLGELRRVTRGELWLVADNRLGYKRSSGRRAEFRVPRPLEYALQVLAPEPGRSTLRGHRRALTAPDFEPVCAFALYPHSRDFSQVAVLDAGAPGPELFVGPMERRNRLKTAAYAAGLFPVLTPSFALRARRRGDSTEHTWLDRALDALAEATGEPRPEVEHLVATRGNSAVIHTRVRGRTESDPRGRWTLHVPLSPQQEVQARRHDSRLRELRAGFPAVPVPEPLFAGELDTGLWLACERRLPGLSAPQLTGDLAAMERLYADLVPVLAELVVERGVVLDEERFEALIGAKFALVRSFLHEPEEHAVLDDLLAESRVRLLGAELPLVVYHSDLRAKHVQIQPDGRLVGLLDWGSSRPRDLPYFDLLNLIVHDRKQESDLTAGAAWRLVQEGALRDFERRALNGFADAIDLDIEVRKGIEAIHPVLVGAMAESNWDFSRPRWVWRNFFGGA